MTSMNEKEEGLKTINEALKKNFKNPIPWHFLALYNKQEK